MKQRWLVALIVCLALSACAAPTQTPSLPTPAPTQTHALAPSPDPAQTGLPTPILPPSTVAVSSPYPVPTIAPTPTPTLTPDPIVVGALDAARALEALYGGPVYTNNWDKQCVRASVDLGETVWATETCVVVAAPFREGRGERYFLVTETPIGDCHPCHASIDAFVWAEADGNWRLAHAHRRLAALGSGGHVNSGELLQIGPDLHGVMVNSGWSGQGYSGTYVDLIAPAGDDLRIVFSTGITGEQLDMQGASVLWSYTSEISFERGANPAHDDIHLRTSGTRQVDRQIVAFDETHTFVFDGQEYVEAPK